MLTLIVTFFFPLAASAGGDGFFIFVSETLMLIDTTDWGKGLQSKDGVLPSKGVKRSGNEATKPSSQMTLLESLMNHKLLVREAE